MPAIEYPAVKAAFIQGMEATTALLQKLFDAEISPEQVLKFAIRLAAEKSPALAKQSVELLLLAKRNTLEIPILHDQVVRAFDEITRRLPDNGHALPMFAALSVYRSLEEHEGISDADHALLLHCDAVIERGLKKASDKCIVTATRLSKGHDVPLQSLNAYRDLFVVHVPTLPKESSRMDTFVNSYEETSKRLKEICPDAAANIDIGLATSLPENLEITQKATASFSSHMDLMFVEAAQSGDEAHEHYAFLREFIGNARKNFLQTNVAFTQILARAESRLSLEAAMRPRAVSEPLPMAANF